MKYEAYKRYNEEEHPFIETGLNNLLSEGKSYNPDNQNIWDVYRNITGVVEYWAQEVIMYTIFSYFKMIGVSYLMMTDDSPSLRKYHEIKWFPDNRPYKSYSTQTCSKGIFHQCLPDLFSTDRAIRFFSLTEKESTFELYLNPDKSNMMWAIWVAKVNSSVAYGNLPGEAITHAWGIDQGIWGEDVVKPAGTWEPAITLNAKDRE